MYIESWGARRDPYEEQRSDFLKRVLIVAEYDGARLPKVRRALSRPYHYLELGKALTPDTSLPAYLRQDEVPDTAASGDLLLISHQASNSFMKSAIFAAATGLIGEFAQAQGLELPLLHPHLYSVGVGGGVLLLLTSRSEVARIWLARGLDAQVNGGKKQYELSGIEVRRRRDNLTALGMGPIVIETNRKNNFVPIPGRMDERVTGADTLSVEEALIKAFNIHLLRIEHDPITGTPKIAGGY